MQNDKIVFWIVQRKIKRIDANGNWNALIFANKNVLSLKQSNKVFYLKISSALDKTLFLFSKSVTKGEKRGHGRIRGRRK